MKKHLLRYLAISVLTLVGTLQAMADLTFSQTASGFPIVGSTTNAVFVVGKNDAEVVTTACRCVIGDIKTITGKQLALRQLNKAAQRETKNFIYSQIVKAVSPYMIEPPKD